MKKPSQASDDFIGSQSPIRVCMYIRGAIKTDVRVLREATALENAGFEVIIVDVESDRRLPLEEMIQGIRVKHLIMPGWYCPSRFKPLFLAKVAQMLIRSLFQFIQTPAENYHAQEEDAVLACYIAARLRRKPVIFDAHEFPLFQVPLSTMNMGERLMRRLSEKILALLLPRYEGVITVSPPIARCIQEYFLVPVVSVVRNIPVYQVVPKSERLRQYLRLGSEIKIALYQGAFGSNRGLDLLILAAKFLMPEFVIVLMGSGEIQATMEALIVSEKVTDRVKIIPSVPYKDLLNWTVSADIGLIVYSPGYSLNVQMCLPNKFFEYLMTGLPVLSSELDAIVEVIKTYDCGRVATSLTPAAIGDAINTMLLDREALVQMQQNALGASQREFNWEKESQGLIRLYHDILTKWNSNHRMLQESSGSHTTVRI